MFAFVALGMIEILFLAGLGIGAIGVVVLLMLPGRGRRREE